MRRFVFLLTCLFLLAGCTRKYVAGNFDIEVIHSTVDYDEDGLDDYSDLLKGAKAEAKRHPDYDDSYVSAGYPQANKGACSDVVWRAFRDAGYSLKDMIDADYAKYPEDYPDYGDSNIGFRRVSNLNVFFSKYATSLTTDVSQIDAFMPGDILIFETNYHIAIVSDYRNQEGIPYIIHNAAQKHFDEDAISNYTLQAHYRFDASKIDPEVFKPWHE